MRQQLHRISTHHDADVESHHFLKNLRDDNKVVGWTSEVAGEAAESVVSLWKSDRVEVPEPVSALKQADFARIRANQDRVRNQIAADRDRGAERVRAAHERSSALAEAAPASGMSLDATAAVMSIADHHGVVIEVRPVNRTVRGLRSAGHSAKPGWLKNKTIDPVDVLLGAGPDKIGQVGHFEPALPDNFFAICERDPRMGDKLVERYHLRMKEFTDPEYTTQIADRVSAGTARVEGGVVIDMAPGAGHDKGFTGDNDVFAIRLRDGSLLSEAEAKPIVDELRADRHVQAQHLNWAETLHGDKDRSIFDAVNRKHTPEGGEPLAAIGGETRYEPTYHKP